MLTLQDLLRTRTAQPPLNKALYFDGVDDYVKVPNSPSLQPSSQITMCVWISTIYRGEIPPYILHKFDPVSPYPGYAVMLNQDGDTGHVGVWVGGGSYVNGVSDVRDGRFHFICGGTNGLTTFVYVDNELEKSYPQTPNLISTTNLFIGSARGVAQFFQGYIAQVLIYSRALSDSEITWNYNNLNNPIRDGLVLWLDARACDTSRNICYDLSGNNNHGTIYGAQVVTLPGPVRAGGRL
jgi:hypothetical protein